jgi:hypothetical protein
VTIDVSSAATYDISLKRTGVFFGGAGRSYLNTDACLGFMHKIIECPCAGAQVKEKSF